MPVDPVALLNTCKRCAKERTVIKVA